MVGPVERSAGGRVALRKTIDALMRAVEITIMLALLVMVLLVFTNVVMRRGFGNGLVVSDELSPYCCVWLVFLGAIVAMRRYARLGVDWVWTAMCDAAVIELTAPMAHLSLSTQKRSTADASVRCINTSPANTAREAATGSSTFQSGSSPSD